MSQSRAILHVDMDAFFAAIEQLDNPKLRGKPILVGSDAPRGVVSTASYEARPYGCHSAQPMAVAKRLCPHAIVVPIRGRRYQQVSDHVFAILHDFTPLVEPLSVDEAFLDVTGSQRLFGDPVTIARSIKQRVHNELQLTASIGVAFNKFLAKLASDLDKPDGLTIITPGNLDDVLLPLPVTRVWGIGPQAAAQLEEMGVQTIADLRDVPLKRLTRRFGTAGEAFHRLARGQDKRSVTPDHQARSIGQENTFTQDVPDADHVRHVLLGHVEQVARRLRRHGLHARRVTIKIRYGDFETITRSATLDSPTDITDTLWHAAAGLFDRWTAAAFQPVRLIGMTASDLTDTGGQMDLFTDERRHRQQRLDQTTDRIAARFGKQSIHRGAAAKTNPNAQSPRTRG